MDSKVVSRAIRKSVWPVLREAGFDAFTSRVAWRHGEESVDVVEFQSLNTYSSQVLGVTSFSFAVRLGKLLLYVPPKWPPKVKNGVQLPMEAECYFRSSLRCSLASDAEDDTIWPVAKDGRNLAWCIQDVLIQLPDAIARLSQLRDRREVLRVLQDQDEQMPSLWGFGRNPSPFRAYLTGYVASSLGEQELAKAKLQEAVDSKCFVSLFTGVEGALLRAV